MKLHVTDLQIGDRITEDVFNHYGLLVLSANTILDEATIAKLYAHSIDYVSIERGSAGTLGEGPIRSREQLQESFEACLRTVNLLFNQVVEQGTVDPELVDAGFMPLADSFRLEADLVSLMLSLEQKDDYTYRHSVQVGMLSYYLAKWKGENEETAIRIGKAGFLHDIGKSKIDPAILKKPTKLTTEEYEHVKTHTLHGFEILRATFGDDSLEAIVALQHHERNDGSGYPNGLRESEICPEAKLVAIADIFSAMTSKRAFQDEQDMLQVLKELHQLSFGQLDPTLVYIFIRNMIPQFIGKKVELNDGSIGTVVMTNPTDLFRPLVQLESGFVDLSKSPNLSIVRVLQ